jgi:hypothetical protein
MYGNFRRVGSGEAAELDIRRAERRAAMQDTASAVADRYIEATRASQQLAQEEVAAAFLDSSPLVESEDSTSDSDSQPESQGIDSRSQPARPYPYILLL